MNIFLRATLLSITELVQACVGYHHFQNPKIAPEAEPYLQSFLEDSKKYGLNLKTDDLYIHVKDDVENTPQPEKGFVTVGICYQNDPMHLEGPYIVLSTRAMTMVSNTYKKILIYHELGHCLLHRDHVQQGEVILRPDRPKSIMYPHVLDEDVYSEHEHEYIDELFINIPIEVKYQDFQDKFLPPLEIPKNDYDIIQ